MISLKVVLFFFAGFCLTQASHRPLIECHGLSIKEFCTTDAIFGYTDGCNFMSCQGKGVGRTTLMLCREETEKDKEICDHVRERAAQKIEAAEPIREEMHVKLLPKEVPRPEDMELPMIEPELRPVPEIRPRIECHGLSFKEFCTTDAKFHYTDGCNSMSCQGKGVGGTTLMLCREETEKDKEICDRVREEAEQN